MPYHLLMSWQNRKTDADLKKRVISVFSFQAMLQTSGHDPHLPYLRGHLTRGWLMPLVSPRGLEGKSQNHISELGKIMQWFSVFELLFLNQLRLLFISKGNKNKANYLFSSSRSQSSSYFLPVSLCCSWDAL